jgi:hypothetical protein
MYETLDETAAQVVLAVEEGDSIRRVAQRIQTPYETVRLAVNELEATGYLKYDQGLTAIDTSVQNAALELVTTSARVSPPSIEEAYIIPHFSDCPFAFTHIDAVYVWTRGGYQIARGPDDYPLFLAVAEEDVGDWKAFFGAFDIATAFERQPSDTISGLLQVVLYPQSELDIELVNGYPVIPREETIDYMEEHFASFQPALEMLDQMYDDIDLGVMYSEQRNIES